VKAARQTAQHIRLVGRKVASSNPQEIELWPELIGTRCSRRERAGLSRHDKHLHFAGRGRSGDGRGSGLQRDYL
jgi:hypothetical protein